MSRSLDIFVGQHFDNLYITSGQDTKHRSNLSRIYRLKFGESVLGVACLFLSADLAVGVPLQSVTGGINLTSVWD